MINTTMWLFVLVLVCCNLLQPLHSLQQLRTASSSTSSRSHHDCLFRRKSALLHAKSVEADQGKLLEGDWDFPDPYVSYLNMCRPLTEEQRRIVQQENDIVTIAPPAPKKKASEEKNDIPKNRYIELIESTREYMKNNPEPFMLAAQELLEAKSGKPVLSNHSIPSIMRVKAKMRQMESEKLSVSLKELIIAVFIERTHSFRLYKLQDSNAAKEFETWRRSHYKRTKKDILPAAKARVIDQVWLKRAPGRRAMHFLTSGPVRSYGLRKAVVILDEIMDEARAGKKAANSTLRSIVRQMRVKPSDFHVESNLHTPLLTQSIVHWDKSRQEMRDIVMAASEQRNQEKAKVSADRKFKVDEEEMTIANKCPSEYFVVL